MRVGTMFIGFGPVDLLQANSQFMPSMQDMFLVVLTSGVVILDVILYLVNWDVIQNME